MQFVEEEIRQLTTMIWESILGLPIQDLSGESPDEPRMISACVQITGAWQGAITLTCSETFASRAAAIMFGLGDAQVGTADMQDALGELANMIGGNVKGLLPEPCQLSLPSVVEGSAYSIRIPCSKVITRVNLECEGRPVRIGLVERELQAA